MALQQRLGHCVDVSQASVPPSTDADTHPSQMEKHVQIGLDAGTKLLRAFTHGLQPTSRKALFVVDLSVRTAEISKAFLDMLPQLELPAYYFGLCEDDIHLEWAERQAQVHAKHGILEGTLKSPGFEIPKSEMPTDLVQGLPPKPDLNILVWSAAKDRGVETLQVPDAVLTKWHDHPVHGATFQDWFKDAQANLFVNQQAADPDAAAGTSPRDAAAAARDRASDGRFRQALTGGLGPCNVVTQSTQ